MRADLDHMEAAFVGSPLAGLPIGHGPSGTVLVADINPSRLHEAWQAADSLASVIGRRPSRLQPRGGDTELPVIGYLRLVAAAVGELVEQRDLFSQCDRMGGGQHADRSAPG